MDQGELIQMELPQEHLIRKGKACWNLDKELDS